RRPPPKSAARAATARSNSYFPCLGKPAASASSSSMSGGICSLGPSLRQQRDQHGRELRIGARRKRDRNREPDLTGRTTAAHLTEVDPLFGRETKEAGPDLSVDAGRSDLQGHRPDAEGAHDSQL